MRIFILGLILISLAWSDIIYLKNGNKVIGTVIKKNKNSIVVEMPNGKISLATKQIKKIVRESKSDTIINQALRLVSLGAFQQAISYLKRSIDQSPQNKNLRRALGDVYFSIAKKYLNQNPEKAFEYFQQAKNYNSKIDVDVYAKQIEKIKVDANKIKQQADSFLQAQNYSEALKKYKEAMIAFPAIQNEVAKSVAHCATELGNDSFNRKEYEQALEYYEFGLQQSPDIYIYIENPWLQSRMQVILNKHLQQKNWAMAISWLDDILKIRPNYLPAIYIKGFALEQTSDHASAYYYYQQVTGESGTWSNNYEELKLLRGRAQNLAYLSMVNTGLSSPKVYNASGEWQKLSTEHFDIYAQNDILLQDVATTLEYHWNLLYTKLSPPGWQKKWQLSCDVYIYPTREDYIQNTGLPEWSDGVSGMTYKAGTLYQHKILLYANAPLLLSNIIPHELTHIMCPWFLDYNISLPLWLNEGIATTSEAQFRLGSRKFTLQRALRRGEIIALDELFAMKQYPSSEEHASIFYAQSFSIVEFLIQEQGGTRNLFEFCRIAAKENTYSALQQVYNINNISELERLWLKYVTK